VLFLLQEETDKLIKIRRLKWQHISKSGHFSTKRMRSISNHQMEIEGYKLKEVSMVFR